LINIDKDLTGVKKNAEKKQQGLINEKVEELREKINESLENEDGWGKIKILLDKDVKKSLEGL